MTSCVLGVSAQYHDSAACVLRDGVILAAAQEERYSRIKHDPSFPEHAIDACLAQAGITGGDLARMAFYEKPLLKLERILDTSMAIAPRGLAAFVRGMPSWFVEKLRVEERVRAQTGFDGSFCYCRHHEAHAASAFFASPFEEAAILTLDGVGEWTTNALGVGRGHRVTLQRELRFPHSLGLLFFLGLVAPTVLRPLERVLGVVGRAVSGVVTAALLAGVYLLVLTPVSWLRRAVSGDPLDRRLEPERESYWEEAERDVDRYRRMY